MDLGKDLMLFLNPWRSFASSVQRQVRPDVLRILGWPVRANDLLSRRSTSALAGRANNWRARPQLSQARAIRGADR